MKRTTILSAFAFTAMFIAPCQATTLTSADSAVFLSTGAPVIVQGPPQSNAPWLWASGFTYISSVAGNGNAPGAGFVAFTAYEAFSLATPGSGHIDAFADDGGEIYFRDVKGVVTPGAVGSFGFSGDFTLAPGDYTLVANVFNAYPWAWNNFTGLGYHVDISQVPSETPEPGAFGIFAALAVAVGLWFRGKR